MASGRVNLAVIAGSAATLAASWAGIVAADTGGGGAELVEPAQSASDAGIGWLERAITANTPYAGGVSSLTLPPLPVAPIAPLQIPDAPPTDLSSLTRIEAKPIAAPRITLPSTASLVPAPAPSTTKVVRKSKAS